MSLMRGGSSCALRCGLLGILLLVAACGGTPWLNEDMLGGRVGGNMQQTAHTEDQKAIVEMMAHAWEAYRKFSWGKDTLLPVSKTSETWFNMGLTIIDSVDTLWLMNMTKEYTEARDWVETELDLAQPYFVNVFECTIRCLGGLLSAYSLTGDELWLNKAEELGSRILPAFNRSKIGIPTTDVNLKTGKTIVYGRSISTSEATTLQLEFRLLAYFTGRQEFTDTVDRVMDVVESNLPADGLVTLEMDFETGEFVGGVKGLGARADSFYEYILKAWLLTNRTEERWRELYEAEVEAVNTQLLRSNLEGLSYLGEVHRGWFYPKMDHLACFYPAVLALGHITNAHGRKGREEEDYNMHVARELTNTCFEMYERTRLKVGPEIAHFDREQLYIKQQDSHSLLRPEAVEAFFVLHRATGDTRYREYGREVYKAINESARLEDAGFAAISSADDKKPVHIDKMESFFLAETLKYLFLLFSEDSELLDFERWVFNTEAHPLPIISNSRWRAAFPNQHEEAVCTKL